MLQPVARRALLVSVPELRPLALPEWAAQLQALSAAVSPLALCVLPSFLSSIFPRRYALRRPTQLTPCGQNRFSARRVLRFGYSHRFVRRNVGRCRRTIF